MSAEKLLHDWLGADIHERCTFCGAYRLSNQGAHGWGKHREREACHVRQERVIERLHDLVRHQRGALYDAELISTDEYAALAAEHAAVARLEGYDVMKLRAVTAEGALVVMEKARDEWRAYADKAHDILAPFVSDDDDLHVRALRASNHVAWLIDEVCGQTGALPEEVRACLDLGDRGGVHKPVVNHKMGAMFRKGLEYKRLLGECLALSGADISGYDDPAEGWAVAPEAVAELRKDYDAAGEENVVLRARVVELEAQHAGAPAGDSLSALIERIKHGWPVDRRVYPHLPEEPTAQLAATTSHVCQHLSKQTGKLADLFEPLLHGAEMPGLGDVSRQVAFTLIDVLRLAELAGVTGEDVMRRITLWEKEQTIVGPVP